MLAFNKLTLNKISTRLLAAAAICSALTATPAVAQQGFSLAISPSELMLAFPDDMAVQKLVMWDSPLMRTLKQSRPFIQVENTSGPASPTNITSFTMTIGDTDFGFGNSVLADFAVLGDFSTPGVTIDSVTPLSGGDAIQINFGNGGLAPGEVARFQVDIDPDPGHDTAFVHPDFRSVFFDLYEEGTATADDSDNTVATALFADDTRSVSLATTLQDSSVPAGSFGSSVFVNAIQPYALEVPVDTFEVPPVEIPEPSSIVLGLIAAFGAAAAAMRRRLG